MPTLRDVKRAGFHRLYSEVQRNGGRKLVAARIGLPLRPGSACVFCCCCFFLGGGGGHTPHTHLHTPFHNTPGGEHGKFATMISYGTFDFDFGIALMEYIMNKCVGGWM